MKLIVFLGNPGSRYRNNRHNVGFLAGEHIRISCGMPQLKKDTNALSVKTELAGESIMLLFPQTYMNKSGEAVSIAMQFYKIPVEDVIVVHDELELSFGDVRVKKGGGHKGHNGLRSIITQTGSADFHRIRIGIGRPAEGMVSVADYVLSDFTADERERLEALFRIVYDRILEVITATKGE